MPDQPDDYAPSDAELEMVVDDARKALGQGPAPRPSLKGIADMQARIKLLTGQKSKLLDQLEIHPTDTQLGNELTAVNKELDEAQKRLAEYQTQFDARN